MKFKDTLFLLRAESGMKQCEVAKIINVDTSMISKYEQGVNVPDYPTMIKIAECFHTNVDFLLGRTNIKSDLKFLEDKLLARNGPIPLDFIFQLDEEDRELLRLLLDSISQKPVYRKKTKSKK